MALSGLDIFKLLPKTNCGDCGVPTCLAFAMKLAQQKVELSECPHASEEAKATLGAASEPPIRLVKIGVGAQTVEIGNETVMFRHEKTFFHQTAIAIRIDTAKSEDQLLNKIKEIENFKVERVGEKLKTDLFFISHDSGNRDDFLNAIMAVKEHSTKGIILDCPDEEILKAGLELLKNDRPSILLKKELKDGDIELAKTFNTSLILSANSFEELARQTEMAKSNGVNDLILNCESQNIGSQLQHNTILRRSALKKN
ncbi:MAG: acetyl-CoA decarbonylase/synthase complex subunit gamma, partial [bacterium]